MLNPIPLITFQLRATDRSHFNTITPSEPPEILMMQYVCVCVLYWQPPYKFDAGPFLFDYSWLCCFLHWITGSWKVRASLWSQQNETHALITPVSLLWKCFHLFGGIGNLSHLELHCLVWRESSSAPCHIAPPGISGPTPGSLDQNPHV